MHHAHGTQTIDADLAILLALEVQAIHLITLCYVWKWVQNNHRETGKVRVWSQSQTPNRTLVAWKATVFKYTDVNKIKLGIFMPVIPAHGA